MANQLILLTNYFRIEAIPWGSDEIIILEHSEMLINQLSWIHEHDTHCSVICGGTKPKGENEVCDVSCKQVHIR